jgi:hypothetical protein
MDETPLRVLFERAVAERPPTPCLIPDAVRTGIRLRRRRKIEAAAGSIATMALIAGLVATAAGDFGTAGPPPSSVNRASLQTAFVWTGTDIVTPVRLSTHRVLTPVKVPGSIADILAAPDGKAAYVFSDPQNTGKSAAGSYVTKISSATGQASRPVRLTGNRLSIIFSIQIAPDGKVAYAGEWATWPTADGTGDGLWLVAIDLTTGAQRKIARADNSFGWAISPSGQTAYNGRATGAVVGVDLTNGTVLPAIKLRAPGMAYGVAFAPDGRTFYAVSASNRVAGSDRETMWVTPIDAATDIAAAPIETPQTGYIPQITIAPDGSTAYVSGGQSLCPVNLATGTALKPIHLPSESANYYTQFGISPSSEFGYVYQTRSSVQLINLKTGTLLRPLALPRGYRQSTPGFSPDGSTLYVPASIRRGARPALGALFPVNSATGRIGKPISFSGAPNGIVIVP